MADEDNHMDGHLSKLEKTLAEQKEKKMLVDAKAGCPRTVNTVT